MKKMVCSLTVALMLFASASASYADADVQEGKASLSVRGSGLSVKRADGSLDGSASGVKARLYTVYKGGRTEITGWKKAKRVSVLARKFSNVGWNLKGRRFAHGTWVCIQFNKASTDPCARIHR